MVEKAKTAFAVTANRLSDGAVLYLDARASWVERFDAAEITLDPAERDRLLAIAKADEAHVCGAYALELFQHADGSRQLSARERLRALGADDVRRRLGY